MAQISLTLFFATRRTFVEAEIKVQEGEGCIMQAAVSGKPSRSPKALANEVCGAGSR